MNKVIHACKVFVLELIKLLLWLLRYRKSSKTEPGGNQGKKVVVFGNGPSAKDFPYRKYIDQGYDICCVNHFALDEELFFAIKPTFYCCVDPDYASADFPKTEDDKRFVSIMERVDWELNLICYRDEHISVLKNPYIKYRYVTHNVLDCEFNSIKNKLYSRNMASCGFQNVIVGAVYYFVMSQADRVILTGVENDWHRELVVGEDCDVYREYVHFYGTERINVTQAGQIGKGELYKYFEWYTTTLKQHATIAKFAKANGVKVENACLPSYIDAYPKIHA